MAGGRRKWLIAAGSPGEPQQKRWHIVVLNAREMVAARRNACET